MTWLAWKSTGIVLDLISKFVKADVRVHNIEAIKPDMAIIFTVNHFTRLETFLLPYELYKRTGGMQAWSLAANEFFSGIVGKYVRAMGAVSTKDPDRDKTIIHSLLKGDHPWIIFPEGAMIKDKKLIDPQGVFEVYSKKGRRPPHTGAANLALRTEFYRHKLQCIADNPHHDGLDEILERFNLESMQETLGKRTVIIPVNITYFPIRARGNLFLRLAKGLVKNLSERALEELSVEGSILAEESDVDITLGEPIDIRRCLEQPRFAELMACGQGDVDALEADPGSVFNDAAREIMLQYMTEIYDNTTINLDHIFATIIRHQKARHFTERAYRNRIFLAAHRILALNKYRVHTLLEKGYRDILYEEASPKFQDFMSLCLKEDLIRRQDGLLYKNFAIQQGVSDFHSVRQKEVAYVIANEIEPLADVLAIVRDTAQSPRREVSREVREFFIREDERIFEEDYTRFYDEAVSKPREVGRPFLLVPPHYKAGVVLIHGYLAAPFEVRALANYLFNQGYAVYGVRLKGHGTLPEDLAETRWEEWYESVNRGFAIVKSLTDNIVIGGFSTGGALALLAAGRKRHSFQAVFSINAPLQLRKYAAHLVPAPLIAANTLFDRFNRRRPSWDYVQNASENAHINYAKNPMKALKQLNEAMDAMEAALPKIEIPTFILQASRDPVVDPDSARLIFAQVGTRVKEMTIVERDRHGIVNGEGSDDVFERVHQFLERTEKPEGPRVVDITPAGESTPDSFAHS